MQTPSAFWSRILRGLEVAVGAAGSEELVGVRQGFRRYFHQGARRSMPIAVVPQGEEEDKLGLPASDAETVGVLRRQVRELEDELGEAYSFYVATGGGLHTVALDDDSQASFVRCWTVISCPIGEAWGGSGSLQIPTRMLSPEGGQDLAGVGTRRRGGLVSSLTARLENRRKASSLATFHALSSLFYGRLEG